jgi:hypothetical protein
VAESLEELWISYNLISSLDGLGSLVNLTTLFVSNNLLKSWSEVDKLVRWGGERERIPRCRPKGSWCQTLDSVCLPGMDIIMDLPAGLRQSHL